jgi:nucleotide-binding universal stress UspA family protein
MKKIILVCDGMQFPEGAFRFARQLNELQPILLTGVFMPQVSFAHLWSYTHALGGPAVMPLIDTGDDATIKKTIRHFENLCQKAGILYQVHKDYVDFALPELRRETRFADLLLLSSERFYHNILGNDDIDYIAEAIHEAECPVLVVPEQFNFPATNVIAYDGSASSVYAIKQFAYLFPELCRRETTVLYLHKDNETPLPHETELKELVQNHFPNVTFLTTGAPAKEAFGKWLAEKGNTLLLTGSYGRPSISQFFHKSFLRDVLAGHKLPVFIAHK